MPIYRNMQNRHQPAGKAGPMPPPNGRLVATRPVAIAAVRPLRWHERLALWLRRRMR